MIQYPTHKETIRCPECGSVQEAEVDPTEPWYTYVHHCEKCGHIIMESEWETVTTEKENGAEIATTSVTITKPQS